MVNIIKEEISLEESLKKKIEFICEFAKVQPTIINGSIRKIDKTNLTYIEPHRIYIKNNLYLAFNYSSEIYVNNLGKKIKICAKCHHEGKCLKGVDMKECDCFIDCKDECKKDDKKDDDVIDAEFVDKK